MVDANTTDWTNSDGKSGCMRDGERQMECLFVEMA